MRAITEGGSRTPALSKDKVLQFRCCRGPRSKTLELFKMGLFAIGRSSLMQRT